MSAGSVPPVPPGFVGGRVDAGLAVTERGGLLVPGAAPADGGAGPDGTLRLCACAIDEGRTSGAGGSLCSSESKTPQVAS